MTTPEPARSLSMPSLKCLFMVQGEGRGHMTQALALRTLLADAGHRVCGVLVGRHAGRDVPDFFLRKIDAPVTYLESPNFACDGHNRAVRPLATLIQTLHRIPHFRESLQRIDHLLRVYRPDLVVNFFEPLGGLYYALYRPTVPMVAIAHQYLFLHPAYRFPPGHRAQRAALQWFTRLTALGAARKLALSLYPMPGLSMTAALQPPADLIVVPPLLRNEVFRLASVQRESFFLAYLLNSGYAEEIIRRHQRCPEHHLHCFWDNPAAAAVERYDATLTFHRLDDDKFLTMMARCRGLVTTAGFESIGEAMYLGKPVLAVPVEGHFEQYCNSLDATHAGAGLAARDFAFDRFLCFVPTYRSPAPAFHRWLQRAETAFVQTLEAAARCPLATAQPLPELATA